MPLPSPNLDDRDFRQLLEEARSRIPQACPEWTDLSPSDPGIVLLELFAHLTEIMIYRLNRVPEKAYVEFLRMIGVQLQPPSAATSTVTFRRSREGDNPIEIPAGTRVAAERADGGGEPPVFTTTTSVTLPGGAREVEVLAVQCELIEGELAGRGTGTPGLSVTAKRPPIVAPTGDELDLVVGLEATRGEIDERSRAIKHGGKTFRVWREVDSFANLGDDPHVYLADRLSGTIQFAPAARMQTQAEALEEVPRALAAIPPAGREIRLWYRRGGGGRGNVAARKLTVLKDPIPGIEVTNKKPATGGRSAETLDNALVRGPQEMHGLERAVTARDYELLAMRSSGAIARARAFTKTDLWTYARPGTVQVALVADLPPAERPGGRVAEEKLKARETKVACERVRKELSKRRPLGTTCLVDWARYKTVRIQARVVVYREENLEALEQRILERLHLTLNPLATEHSSGGWAFGEALRRSHIYDILLSEPGVKFADGIRLLVDAVPDEGVTTVAADRHQPRTWYAAAADRLFRSLNDGDGWESALHLESAQIRQIAPHPERPGLMAIAVRPAERGRSRIMISRDCGETWAQTAETGFEVESMTWLPRQNVPTLLLATDVGLYQLPLRTDAPPVEVLVSSGGDKPDGYYAVTAHVDYRGEVLVALAAQKRGGVYLSREAAKPKSFIRLGLDGEDIRTLAVQADGPNAWLWAGAFVPGNVFVNGCHRWYLTEDSAEGWRAYKKDWKGGSCHSLAFHGTEVFAASHHLGVLQLDAAKRDPAWRPSEVSSGLPLRDTGRLHPVQTVASNPSHTLLFAAGPVGVFRSQDHGDSYAETSSPEFDKVTLPPTWLFCSGEHEIEVVSEDEAERD